MPPATINTSTGLKVVEIIYLATPFYNNAKSYAGVVLQIGSAYGSKICQ